MSTDATTESAKAGEKIAVHWVPDGKWHDTSPEVQAIGISRYCISDNGSSKPLPYTLTFINTKGSGFIFWDKGDDIYRITTIRAGEHFVSYTSEDGIITAVGSI